MRALCLMDVSVREEKNTPTVPMTKPNTVAPNSMATMENHTSTSLVTYTSPKPTVAICHSRTEHT